jgi:tRNA (adenine37-N6)-methyltransferase
MNVTPIGIVHSPYQYARGTPIQPFCAEGSEGKIELFNTYVDGLLGLEGFQRIWVLFWCHRSMRAKLTVIPYRDSVGHGLFATRVPSRPNAIGLSSLRLFQICGNMLHVGELDILDGSPVLDIKPYVSQYGSYPAQRCGWLEVDQVRHGVTVADDRFEIAPAQRHK